MDDVPRSIKALVRSAKSGVDGVLKQVETDDDAEEKTIDIRQFITDWMNGDPKEADMIHSQMLIQAALETGRRKKTDAETKSENEQLTLIC